jgi:hypothetical protein
MLFREGCYFIMGMKEILEKAKFRILHEFWEEYEVNNQPKGSYKKFYFCPKSGQISLDFPRKDN